MSRLRLAHDRGAALAGADRRAGVDPVVAVDRRLEAGQDVGQALADVDVVHVDAALADHRRELGHDRQVALERQRTATAAWARRAADVTTRSPRSVSVPPIVHSSANDPMLLRMKSRRDQASAGGRNGLRGRLTGAAHPQDASACVPERLPSASRACSSTV